MYRGSGKLGRGGGCRRSGGGAGKRKNNLHPPPIHRPASSSGRLSSGGTAGPHNRNAASGGPPTSAPSTGAEETFDLVTGNPLDFAMIIRLAPDLVEEIKRAEADGGAARIKFDSNPNNPSGNVIDVGGKDFRFTWSREMGDLCDIYEERQSGEDGNGLLVESGCAWRKLNVQRVLDESTKNHVKMRSEEAEKKLKSRKAIILDHGNPSMKSQVKALAAAESNPRRKPFKQKEREFKKRKIEKPPVAVGGLPKSSYKSGFPSAIPLKGRPSVSPLPSPPVHSVPPASPFRTGNLTKGPTSVEHIMAIHGTNKECATNSEKDVPNRANSGALREMAGRQGNLGAKPMDMQSMLISLLSEKPEGMSLKALEKAVGDIIPTTSIRKIEPILKKIATFQAPGRYILKSGVELENSKKPLSEIGSSPEAIHHQTPAPEDKCNDIFAPTPNFEEKAAPLELEKQAHLDSNNAEDLDPFAEADIQHHIHDLFGEKKVSDNTEGLAGSSSDSGSASDSDSDSSDSGSDSGSRSKSRSPVGSGSRDSSDSDSKQGSDEDVDIMSDDDKESKPKLHTSEPGFSTSPIPWRTSDVGSVQNAIGEKQDGSGSDVVEIEIDLPGDVHETGMAVFGNSVSHIEGETPVEDNRLCSPDYQEHQASQVYIENLFGETENIAKDGFKSKKTDNSERISKGKSKSKRGSHSEQVQESKKRKLGSLPQPKISRAREYPFPDSPKKLSPERVSEDHYTDHSTEMMNKVCRDGNADYGMPKVYDQGIHNKSVLDYQDSRRAVDISARVKSTDTAERPSIYSESLGRDIKNSERTHNSQEGLPAPKGRLSREIRNEDCNTQEKKVPRSSREGAFGDQHSTHFDSYNYGRHVEPGGKLKEPREVSNSHMGFSPKDNNRTDVGRSFLINGRGKILQRELSDLELGELREPLPEETPGAEKNFDRKSSFEQSQNKPSASDDCNSEKNKVKCTVKTIADSGKASPANIMVAPPNNPDGSSKRTPEHHAEDLTRQYHGVVQSQDQGPQHLARLDRSEGTKKSTDVNGKLRHNEARASQGINLEGFGETHKQASVNAPQQHDNMKQGPVSHHAKENKTLKSNIVTDSNEIWKETCLTENNEAGLKRRESCTDDNSCSYTKYEKEEPELREPITDISQYKEYVQEYREKYDSYCSLNKTLESYRNDFHKLGSDLENAKGKDTGKYYSILGQLKESYRQCGTRHKRLKKIFVVLHEELQHLKQMIKDYAVLYTRD